MRTSIAVTALGFVWLGACGKHAELGATKPSTSTSMLRRGTPAPSASTGGTVPHIAPAKGTCRALAVAGKANVEGAPIAIGTVLDGEHWVQLEDGSSVSLRHSLTSRELKLIGPGLVLPCRHGLEQVLLSEGKLSTFSSLGVRPGAEVLIATPSGTIHYGDAALDVQFGPKGLRVRVKEGEAWLEPRDPAETPPKNPLRSPKEAALPASKLGASGLAEACKASAEAAASSALLVLQPNAAARGDSLGKRAAAQMRDRNAARASCATAAAATGGVADPAERQSLWASIAHSDELWQSVPHAVSAQKN
jgi:hypothetical protein